jgi:hypothetical protein
MCGICGVFGPGDGDTVRATSGTVTHRWRAHEHSARGKDFARRAAGPVCCHVRG